VKGERPGRASISAAPPPVEGTPAVKDYMVGSVIFTVGNFVLALFIGITIFGVITGIIAIVFASQVSKRLQSGDRTGARDVARVTRIFYWITLAIFAVGVVIFLLLIIVVLVGLFALTFC
jgi:hypothetical protein